MHAWPEGPRSRRELVNSGEIAAVVARGIHSSRTNPTDGVHQPETMPGAILIETEPRDPSVGASDSVEWAGGLRKEGKWAGIRYFGPDRFSLPFSFYFFIFLSCFLLFLTILNLNLNFEYEFHH